MFLTTSKPVFSMPVIRKGFDLNSKTTVGTSYMRVQHHINRCFNANMAIFYITYQIIQIDISYSDIILKYIS